MATSSAPEFPYPGGTPGDEPADPVAGKPGHFAWSRWIKQYVKNLNASQMAHEDSTDPHPNWILSDSGSTGAIDMLNVKDAPYSARGDGITDDTAALQACINDAATLGKIAYLPAGDYRVTIAARTLAYGTDLCALSLPSNTRLVGDGPGPDSWKSQDPGTVFGWPTLPEAGANPSEFGGTTRIFTTSTGGGSILSSINTRRVSVERLAVHGPGRTGNTINAIRFGYVTMAAGAGNSVPFYINATDVWVAGCGGDGFQNQTVCVGSFRNCVASDIGGTGFHHPEGSTSCAYIACWARSCTVGWHFNGSIYCNLSGCAADYCNTSYWVSDAQTIGFYGCGSEFPIDLGAADINKRGYSWRFDHYSNCCTVSSCEVIGNPYRGIWITEGASMNTFMGIAESPSASVTTGQNFIVADGVAGQETFSTLINIRNDKPNLFAPTAVVNILDDDQGSMIVGRDATINRDLHVKGSGYVTGDVEARNLYAHAQTAQTVPFFNASMALVSSKMLYDDTPVGGSLTSGEVHVAGATALTVPFFNANKALISSQVTYDTAGTGTLSTGAVKVTGATSNTVPFFNANKALASSKLTYDDAGTGTLTAGAVVTPTLSGGGADVTLQTHVAANGKTIWGLAVPTGSDWAATKGYVDGPRTMTGKQTFPASATTGAPVNIPHGAAPTTPVNGDMWTTSAGLFIRINGVTKTVTLT